MHKLIAVIGGADCTPEVEEQAFEVGKLIADNGFGLICGGRDGVMAAAARGCKEAAGLTVGIIPSEDRADANPFIDVVIPTGMGIMRNVLVVRSAMGIIALKGKYGTLSELAYALQLGVPVVGLGTWQVSETVPQLTSPQAAVNALIERIVERK